MGRCLKRVYPCRFDMRRAFPWCISCFTAANFVIACPKHYKLLAGFASFGALIVYMLNCGIAWTADRQQGPGPRSYIGKPDGEDSL